MLVRSYKHTTLKRTGPFFLGETRLHYARAVHVQPNAMARDAQCYKDWSHESLVERVEFLEKQLKGKIDR